MTDTTMILTDGSKNDLSPDLFKKMLKMLKRLKERSSEPVDVKIAQIIVSSQIYDWLQKHPECRCGAQWHVWLEPIMCVKCDTVAGSYDHRYGVETLK